MLQDSMDEDAVIAAMYRAATGETPWREALNAINSVTGCWVSQLMGVDLATGRITYSYEGGDGYPEAIVEYVRHYHQIDPHLQYLIPLEPGQARRLGVQPLLPGCEVVEDLHAALEVGRAGLGQRQAPGGAVQQPRAQARFELQHLAREYGLGGLLPLGGLDVAARAHHGDEGFDLAQGVHGCKESGLGRQCGP